LSIVLDKLPFEGIIDDPNEELYDRSLEVVELLVS